MAVIGFDSQPRYSELVTRVFGEQDLVPPGIMLEQDPIEWWVHKRKWPWIFRRSTVAGGVGNLTTVGAFNPSPDVIVVVDTVVVRAVTAGAAFLSITDTQLAAIFQADLRDPRFRGSPLQRSVVTVVNKNNDATTPGLDTVWEVETKANIPVQVPIPPFVLRPGMRGLNVTDQTANEAFAVSMAGYEVIARPEELA